MGYPENLNDLRAAVESCRLCPRRQGDEVPYCDRTVGSAAPDVAPPTAPDIVVVTDRPPLTLALLADLEQTFGEVGIDPARLRYVPLVRCGDPTQKPDDGEILACRAHLLAEIAALRPAVVLALGTAAERAFFPTADAEPDDGEEPHHSDPAPVSRTVEAWTHPYAPDLRPYVAVAPSLARVASPHAAPSEVRALADAVAAVAYFADVDGRRPPADTGRRDRPVVAAPEGCAFVGASYRGSTAYLHVRGQDGSVSFVRASDFVPAFRHYFLLWAGDLVSEQSRAAFVHVCREGVEAGRRRIAPTAVEKDPFIPDWLRVYVDLPPHYVSRFEKMATPENDARFLTTVSPALRLAKRFEAAGVRTFEADLDPVRRFLTDYRVDFAADLRIGCLDIETDDSTGRPVAEIIGRVPVLSVAVRDCATKEDLYARAETDDDRGECALLTALFAQVLPKFDFVYAWNGANFDWPFLFARAHRYGLTRYLFGRTYWDSLLSFRKHHAWDAESKAGYSLDNVARTLLGEGKVERASSVKALWRDDPASLARYNVGDVDRTERIERKTGYVSADLALNRLANCPPDTTYVSFRVDGLALAEGYARGTHFRTKFMRPDGADDEKYHGAFVLEPVRGVHADVANFDFASLYPSVFASWNVSPDAYLPPAEAARRKATDPASVTTCPTVEVSPGVTVGGSCFVKGPLGVIPSVYDRVAKKRAEWKKEAARFTPNSPEYLAARRMEYAYKTLGLSMYGVMGSVFSRFYDRAVAEAVTLTAQFLIRLTMEAARRQGFTPLYGDTDSVFVAMPQEKVRDFLALSARLYAAVGAAFNCDRNLIELEYEQFFGRIVLIGKKRYFGRLVVQKGKPCDVLEVKGLELRRSDGLAAVRRLQTDLVEGLARGGWTERRTVDWAIAVKERLFAGGFGADDLKITGGVQKPLDEYAQKTPPPHVVVARRMRDAGIEVNIGTKIAYVVLDGLKGVKNAQSVEEWTGDYDPVYYWCNKLWPALSRVLVVALPGVDWSVLDSVWYPKVKNRLQPVSVRSVGTLAEWSAASSL